MKTNVISIAALALMVLASGCGGKGSDSDTAAGGISNVIRNNADGGATFVADCQDMQMKGLGKVYVQSRFTFMPAKARESGLSMYSEQIEIYSDSKCKNSDHLATISASGDYSFNGNGTRAVVNYKNHLFIPQRDKFASDLNAAGYCGLAGWQTGVGREMSREGSCWETAKSAALLITSLDEDDHDKISIYNCADRDTMTPTGDCMKLKAERAE